MTDYADQSAKEFSITMAYACFRYAIGGRHSRITIDDCIKWLTCLKESRT